MNFLSLVARLLLDKSDYEQGMDDAEKSAEGFGGKLKSGLGAAAKVGAAAVTAVAGAASAAMEAMVASAGATAAYGDNIDKASQKMGISAEAYQEWAAVMQHSGTSIDSLRKGMMTLAGVMDEMSGSGDPIVDPVKVQETQVAVENAALAVQKAQIDYQQAVEKNGKSSAQAQKALISLQQAQSKAEEAEWKHSLALQGETQDLSEAAKAIAQLGVETKDASGEMRAQEDVFADAITALQNIEDESRRTTLAQQLFGRGAMELGPLLNTSAEDTQAMRDKVHELGGVMSNDAVKASAAYQNSLQDMTTALDGVKRNISAEFLPGLTSLMDGFAGIITGQEDANEKISEGMGGVVTAISTTIDSAAQLFPQIVTALGGAITENLPGLMESGTTLIMTLAQAAIEALPQLLEVGVQVITTTAGAIAENLPTLIPAAVGVITQMYETLTDPETLSALVDGAIAIILALAEGLIEALPQLIEAAPTIVANLVTALIENAPKILEAAAELIVKLAEGILDNLGKVDEAIGKVIDGIVTAVKGIIDKALTWGKELLGNFGSGIGQAAGEALRSVQNFVSNIWNNGFKSIVDGAVNWGSDLVSNFTNGIKNMAGSAVEAVKGLAGRIAAFLHFSEPDEGPLANFSTYAPDMMKLFAEGIRQNEHLVTDAIGGAFDLQPAISAAYGRDGGFTGGGAGSAQEAPQRPVQVIFEVNGMQQMVYNLVHAEVQRVGLQLSGVTL